MCIDKERRELVVSSAFCSPCADYSSNSESRRNARFPPSAWKQTIDKHGSVWNWFYSRNNNSLLRKQSTRATIEIIPVHHLLFQPKNVNQGGSRIPNSATMKTDATIKTAATIKPLLWRFRPTRVRPEWSRRARLVARSCAVPLLGRYL